MKRITFTLLLILLLEACGSTATPVPVSETPPLTPTEELAPPPAFIIAPTLVPNPSATPDTRLPPEQWQEWPVVPSVTARAIEIYKTGLAMGNNPHAFSKAGDCQNIREAFMGYFDIPDRHNLQDYQNLQETVDNFSGYFNTDGQAVMGGFTPATVLTPLWANPNVCKPGESPLECELRITKPIIVFISFEVWWEGRTPETYEKYMRQIIETVITHGAVPILATKADNKEGNQSINLTTARLSHEYNLPLWNFWLAAQSLPNHGLDPVRNDGFHISMAGWNTRSFTGLQALDSIWRGIRETTSGGFATLTPAPEATQSTNLLPIPAGGPSLGSKNERVVFSLMTRQNGTYDPRGVYLFDFSAQTSAQLLGSGFNLQFTSPDGKYLLVNQGSALYRTDGSTLTLLTEKFYDTASSGALWLPDGRIALILHQDKINSLVLMQADGSSLTKVAVDAIPMEIYASTDGRHLTWESGACDSTGLCTPSGAWMTDLSSGQSQLLSGMTRPLISPDGQSMAYAYIPQENKSNLAFTHVDGLLPHQYPLAGDILDAMTWQPSGGWLAVYMAERSDYSGRVTGGHPFLINSQTYSTRQLQSVTLLNPNMIWSPDGATLLLVGTDSQNTSYFIRLWKVDVASGRMMELSNVLNLTDSTYLFVNSAAWLANQ
jgi:Tol biopolymer transport system component